MESFILIALIREQLEFRTNSRGKPWWYEWVSNTRDVKYSSIRPRIAGKHFWKISLLWGWFSPYLALVYPFPCHLILINRRERIISGPIYAFQSISRKWRTRFRIRRIQVYIERTSSFDCTWFGGSGFVPMARLWVHLLSSGVTFRASGGWLLCHCGYCLHYGFLGEERVSGGEKVLDKLYFNNSLLDAFSPLL